MMMGFICGIASYSHADESVAIMKVWDSFIEEVASNNIEGALQYIGDEEFKRIFGPVLHSNKDKFSKKRDLKIIYIKGKEAKLEYQEDMANGPIFTDIIFEKTNGQWKIKHLLSWSNIE